MVTPYEERYQGAEDLTSQDQIIRYLKDNYVDDNGDDLGDAMLQSIVDQDLVFDIIQNGVANRSFVYYIGDMIADGAGFAERDPTWDIDDDEGGDG